MTLPTCLNEHSMYPLRVGALAMQKVLSPAPNAEYSPNWPALKVNASASAGSAKARRSVRVSIVSSTIDSMRMR